MVSTELDALVRVSCPHCQFSKAYSTELFGKCNTCPQTQKNSESLIETEWFGLEGTSSSSNHLALYGTGPSTDL